MNGDGGGDGAGTGMGTEVEANEGAQYGNEDGSEDGVGTARGRGWRVDEHRMGTGTGAGTGNESSSGDGNGDEDGNGDRNEDGIGEGGREANKRKKPHRSCRRNVGNGGDLDGKRKTRRRERVGSVAANPDNLENSKEAEGKTRKNCTSRENVCLCRFSSEVFVISTIDPPLGGSMRVA